MDRFSGHGAQRSSTNKAARLRCCGRKSFAGFYPLNETQELHSLRHKQWRRFLTGCTHKGWSSLLFSSMLGSIFLRDVVLFDSAAGES